MSDLLTAEQRPEEIAAALDVARSLAHAGIPVFVAAPDPTTSTGFALPQGWHQLAADPAVVDRWAPGMALGAVMGHGLDLLDVDLRNGGDLDALGGAIPASYGAAATPSGGLHSFVASLGVGSRDNVTPGIDVKGGLADGTSHGFAFLPPTVKPSKVDGTPTAYRWITAPDLPRLAAAHAAGGDGSGAGLAARIRELRGTGAVARVDRAPKWYRPFLESREPQSVPAATRAITEKLAAVADWTPASTAGFRQTLMRAAMTLGGYVGGGWLAEGDAWGRLETATAQVWGSADEADRKWIEQGLTDGASSPFHVYTAEDEQRFGDAAQAVAATRVGPSWSPQRALGAHPFDPAGATHDQELAETVAARTAPVLRYGVDTGTWLKRRAFEVWAELPDQAAAAVADVARLMPLGETPVPKELGERTEMHWQAVRRGVFLSSPGSSRIERKLKALVAGGDHPCTVDVSALDSDAEVLWAGGWPFDLRASGEVPTLAAIHPDTPHLHTAACAPAVVETPVWDTFVAAVFPDDELRAWAMRVLSLTLAGYPDAALPVLYGPERTGKTALVTLLVRVLGTYGHAADPRLLAGAEHTHASVVYALKGRRLSFIDEGPRRGHLAAERLKQLTGGGQLTGNAMRSNPVTFSPTHTLVMTTNDEPPITDPALRARVRLIPCDAEQSGVRAARQALTAAVWEREAPGVLAALMREAAAWLAAPDSANLTAAPAQVRTLMGEMAAGQDPVREWTEDCTLPVDPPGTSSRDLYRRFLLWVEGQPAYRRQTPPSETAFGRSLTEQGFPWHWGGPRGNLKYRPLSVMNPGGEPAPWAPPAPGSSVPGPFAPSDGLPTVADGSVGPPSETDNSRSSGLFSSSSDSSDSYPCSMNTQSTDTPKWSTDVQDTEGKRGATPNRRTIADENGTSPAKTGAPGPSGQPAEASATRPGTDDRAGTSAGAPGTPASSHLVAAEAAWARLAEARAQAARERQDEVDAETAKKAEAARLNREVAALAAEQGIPKKDARAAIRAHEKEAARLAAVAAAGGPVHALPAVVDRTGAVVPVDVETATQIVRARVVEAGALTVDVETSGYPVGHRDFALRSVQLGDAMASVVLHPVEHAAAIRDLVAAAPALHAHSATADLVPLAMAGLLDHDEAWARMWDTTIPARLADPASTGSDPGLKKLASAVLGDHATAPAADDARSALFKAGGWLKNVEPGTAPERSGWAQVETGSETMLRYAASDVLDTAALARALPRPDPIVAERERLAQRMTARGAYRGIRLDGEHVDRLTAHHTEAKAEVAAKARAFGVANPGSDQQVAARAVELGAQLPRTATGRPSVAAGVLEPLRGAQGDLGAFVGAVLDYRHADTVLGLFLAPYADLCERGDGRARPTVYTLGTNTGRMSCVRPNLQQLSREGGVRACITADPGQTIISADFSGVELRVAAALSGDPNLRAIITAEDGFTAEVAARAAADGTDEKAARKAILAERGWVHAGAADGLHWLIARQIWGDAATKANRYVAKRIVFGRVYGGGVANLSAQVGVSVETGQAVLDTLDAITPTLKGWSRSISDAAKAGHTRFPAYSGRTIHLPGQTPHAAPNYCVTPDTLILRSDLRHVAASEIAVGDRLVAFDEHVREGETYRRMRTADVEAASIVQKSSVIVRTADGKASTCSTGHLWLVRPKRQQGHGQPRTRWVKAGDLVPGDVMLSLGTWDEAAGRTAGYLAGLYDGEGSMQSRGEGHGSTALGFAQLQGPVMDAFCAGMDELGLGYGYYRKPPKSTSPTDSVYVNGVRNVMRTLGTLQPERFKPRFEAFYEGARITAGLTESVEVTAVEDAGEIELVSLQTSTRTLVANGYLSHNCIQGSARELLVDALGRWADTRWGDATLIPVHDELLAFVPAEDGDAATAELQRCMAGELHGIPIVSEADAPSFAWADSA